MKEAATEATGTMEAGKSCCCAILPLADVMLTDSQKAHGACDEQQSLAKELTCVVM